MPDWDNTESRESDEDAAWRDLVARFEEPATTTEPVPWPERENVPGPRPQAGRPTDATDGTPGFHGTEDTHRGSDLRGKREIGETRETPGGEGTRGDRGDGATPGDREDAAAQGGHGDGDVRGTHGTRGVEGIRGFDDEGVRGTFGAEGQPGTDADGRTGARAGRRPGAHEPDVIQAPRRGRRTAAHGTRARNIRARKAPPQPGPGDDDEHYIPPAPPPLPKLDPITKGAWAALFGGPAYLVIATAVGWSVPGIAAFCAVAAFVTGFAILVLRMNEPRPGGPDDGDDGAVV